MKVKISKIKQICLDILQDKGLNKKEAEIVVAEHLYGELTGRKSHGFMAFPKTVEKIKSKKSKWKVIKEDKNYVLIDGHGGLGQLVADFAVKLAIQKAQKSAIALIGMNNMESYLIPGYWAKKVSDQNMIGVVIDNARSRVAPYGGVEPKLGTNPIAIAIPASNIPFVLDMATATRAMGEVRLAQKLGKLLPRGMAVDEKGKLTADPKKVAALTALGGYKGYGLCLAIEILAGSFVRAKMGSKIQSGLDRGYLFLVINPKIFVNIDTFKQEINTLLKEVKSCKKQRGVKKILIPGEKAQKLMQENLKKGYLEIDNKTIEEIKNFK